MYEKEEEEAEEADAEDAEKQEEGRVSAEGGRWQQVAGALGGGEAAAEGGPEAPEIERGERVAALELHRLFAEAGCRGELITG